MNGVNEYAFVACFGMQTAFLFLESVKKAARDDEDGDGSAEVHAGKRPGEAAGYKTGDQRSNTPGDELALEATVDQWFLQAFVNGIPSHHTPKKALMTTETSTRNRQEPPQPMISLLISWSPAFHLM